MAERSSLRMIDAAFVFSLLRRTGTDEFLATFFCPPRKDGTPGFWKVTFFKQRLLQEPLLQRRLLRK
jgi:hypothetical protein